MQLRRSIGNLPLIGRYIIPGANRKSIFSMRGDYYAGALNYPPEKFGKNYKIVVFGVPKSGNTWVVSLLSDYLNLPAIRYYQDKGQSGVTMLHNPLRYALKVRKDIARGAYVLRDIRDVVVSFYHYAQTEYYQNLNDKFFMVEGIEMFYYDYFLTKMVPRYDIMHHAKDYAEQGVPLVSYERLWEAPVETLCGLLHRMGLPVDEDKAQQAVEKNRIQELSKEGKQLWDVIPSTHFRKGGFGAYKTELPAEIIEDMNRRFRGYLERWGYLQRY